MQLSHIYMGTYRGCDCARAVSNSQSLIRRSGGIADAVVSDDSRRRADSNEGLHNSLYIYILSSAKKKKKKSGLLLCVGEEFLSDDEFAYGVVASSAAWGRIGRRCWRGLGRGRRNSRRGQADGGDDGSTLSLDGDSGRKSSDESAELHFEKMCGFFLCFFGRDGGNKRWIV